MASNNHWWLKVLFTVVLSTWACSARGYYLPLVIDPSNPISGQPTHFSVTFGFCDAIQAPPPFQYPEWQIVGTTVRATVRAVEYYDFVFCNIPQDTFRYELPNLPVGTYRLELYRYHIFEGDTRLVQTTQFVVGAAPVSVPTSSWWGLSGLAIMLAALGAYFMRRRSDVFARK